MATLNVEKANEKEVKETCNELERDIQQMQQEIAAANYKLPLDEVAAAYMAAARVENFESLGDEFGGYKVGAIYSFVLGVLNEHINKSVDAREMARRALFADTSYITKPQSKAINRLIGEV